MADPSPVGELARRLVEHEAGGMSDPSGSAAAVESACRKLRDELTDILGAAGIAALFRRALKLAQRDHPLLAGVVVTADSTTFFTNLTQKLAGASDDEAFAAGESIVNHLLQLLVMLLGEDLTMYPVSKIWPQLVINVTEMDG